MVPWLTGGLIQSLAVSCRLDYEVGRVAKLYEEMGGQVHWIGKPHRAIYDHALSLVPKQGRVVCIGDSLAHDIAGAHSLGLQTALVQSGLSANLSMVEIEETASSLGALPDFIVPQFFTGLTGVCLYPASIDLCGRLVLWSVEGQVYCAARPHPRQLLHIHSSSASAILPRSRWHQNPLPSLLCCAQCQEFYGFQCHRPEPAAKPSFPSKKG